MRSILSFGSIVFLLGCGGSTGPVTTVGMSILTSDVQTVIAENQGGGFVPQPPPGSECSLGAAKYTLNLATKNVDWTRCASSGTTPYKQTRGARVLSDADFRDLRSYIEKLTVVADDDSCGADKPTLQLTVKTTSGEQVYGDSFYACNIVGQPLIKSEALDSLLSKFNALTQ